MNIDDSVRKFGLLSKRQKEVLRRVCKGMPYKKIAKELFIAESTVKAHMVQIYTKLDLIELPRDERIFQIRSVYCPLLKQEEEKRRIIVVEPEIDDENQAQEQEQEDEDIDEVISPEMNAIILYDEKALMKLKGGSESMRSDTQPIKIKKKKSIVLRIFGILVVLTALGFMVTGGYVVYKVFICGEVPAWLAGKIQPTPEVVVMEPEAPAPEVAVQEEPEVEIVEVEEPPAEIVVAEPTPMPTPEPVQPTVEILIAPTVEPTVEVKEYYDVGEWAKEGNVSMRLKDYNLRQDHAMELEIEIWNQSSKDLLFSWSPNLCFVLTDNTGNIYEIWDPYDYSTLDNEVVKASQVQVIRYKGQNEAAAYVNDPMFNSEVTELYLIVQEFSVFKNVKFKITK